MRASADTPLLFLARSSRRSPWRTAALVEHLRGGNFGARASRLLPYLKPAHHDVKLSPADLRRVTLWLDCNSGSYENTAAQRRGEIVKSALE